jgi:hypothetical protein
MLRLQINQKLHKTRINWDTYHYHNKLIWIDLWNKWSIVGVTNVQHLINSQEGLSRKKKLLLNWRFSVLPAHCWSFGIFKFGLLNPLS